MPFDEEELDPHGECSAEIRRLQEVIKAYADQVERLAFRMPPPNPYTPDFVMLANGMRSQLANGQSTRATEESK
jgi:hypothetical protein